MTPKDFFYLVAEMRHAQSEYFKTRSTRVLAAAKMLEKQVDDEITRVRIIVNRHEEEANRGRPENVS